MLRSAKIARLARDASRFGAADPLGRGRPAGDPAPRPRGDRRRLRRGREALRGRGDLGVPPAGAPDRRAPDRARGRDGARGRPGRAHHRHRDRRTADPGASRRPVLDEPGGDLGTGRPAGLARGDRHRRDRHRVRADLRAVRHGGHRDRGAPADPAQRGRGRCRGARPRVRGGGDHPAAWHHDRPRGARRPRMDDLARRWQDPASRGAPRRRGPAARVRRPRPRCGRPGARRSRAAGTLRDAPHHGPERVGGGRRDRGAPVHARRLVRGRDRDRRHPRHGPCARLPRGPARDVLRSGGRERRADRARGTRRRPRGPHRDPKARRQRAFGHRREPVRAGEAGCRRALGRAPRRSHRGRGRRGHDPRGRRGDVRPGARVGGRGRDPRVPHAVREREGRLPDLAERP